MSILPKLLLTARTVCHMTPKQWFYRLYYMAAARLSPAPRVKPVAVPAVRSLPCAGVASADTMAADEILHNRFPTVGGMTEVFEDTIDWDLTGCDYRLRCFRLNSFSFLETLSDAAAATGDPAYIQKGFALMDDWALRCGGRMTGDKWNPYVIAQRLRCQIRFLSAHATESQHLRYAPLLAAQAKRLSRRVEYQLGANHLLSEGCALMYAGAYLNNGKFYTLGRGILEREFHTQFLPDGGHYERSVSYHCESLQQYFEAVWLMTCLGDRDADFFIRRLQRPTAFLNAMLSSGSIPTVNDAALDYPFDAADLLAAVGALYTPAPPNGKPGVYARRFARERCPLPTGWELPPLLRATGFLSFRIGSHTLFLDAGDHGPDCNLGHTHADALSLLWSIDREPVFTDCGVYTYAPGDDRSACRATAAHNTVEVDGQSSAEVWSAFRTARRGHTTIEAFQNNSRSFSLTASHDGYRKVLPDPVTHRRTLTVDKEAMHLTLTDTLIPTKASHTGVLRFHLAPGCDAVAVSPHTVLLKGVHRLHCTHPIAITPSRVARRFGIPENTVCLTIPFQIDGETSVVTTIQL